MVIVHRRLDPIRPGARSGAVVWGLVLGALGAFAPGLVAQGPSGAFIARRAAGEVTRERYRFADGVLTSGVDVPARGLRLEARTEYTARLAPSRYHVSIRAISGSAAIQDLDATFGDSVRWTVRTPSLSRSGAEAISRPFALLQSLMFSHLALILRRYDRTAGGVQVVDVWLPDGSRVGQLRMALRGDSGTVELGGTELGVRVGRNGWLRSVRVPAQGLVVEWMPELPSEPARANAGSADTLAPADVRESSYAFANGTVRLEGTLTVPQVAAGPVPAAVIVGGSGPTDRDGNNPPLLRSNLYAQLAWRLAERGIATLRYDKRGIGASRGGVEPGSVTVDELAADAVAAARALRADARFHRLVLVGHGEGAWIVIRASTQGAPAAGIALLSGLGRPFAAGIREQLGSQLGVEAVRRFDELFPRYLSGDDVAGAPDYLRPLLAPANRSFTRSLAAFDPLKELRTVTASVLIVQGGMDIQASLRDAELLRTAKRDAQFAVLPHANHVYKTATTRERAAQLALYSDTTLPVEPELVEVVAGWVAGLR